MSKRLTLERMFPNLYGWLVWGGGFHTLSIILKIIIAIAIVGYIFFLGFFVGMKNFEGVNSMLVGLSSLSAVASAIVAYITIRNRRKSQ